MNETISRVVDAIRAFERGEMIVVTDDNDRENEGDLIIAAEHCTSEKMAFMVRHTSGIICAPMTISDAQRLRLDPMVAANDAPLGTAFTVSVDYKHGLTTGISADERTSTVRALANGNNQADDFVRPGHVFPLIAREGGVLMRSGHTEACVDFCRLAGLTTVGAIGELVNDDGTVKRGADVTAFAKDHELVHVSVADLIAYRQRKERLVERDGESDITTPHGPARAIAYRTPFDNMHHIAVVFGDIRDGVGIPVRLHLERVVDDVFGRQDNLAKVMEKMSGEKRGVIIYLREGSTGVTSSASPLPVDGLDLAELEHHESAQSRDKAWREIGLGAQILSDLGISSIKLLASKERRYIGLSGFGIEIEETEMLDG